MKMYGGVLAMTSSIDKPEQLSSARDGGGGSSGRGRGGLEKQDKLSFNIGGGGDGGCGGDDDMEKLRGMGGGVWGGSGGDKSAQQPSLTDAAQQRALDIIDQMNSRRDTKVFILVSFWKNITMYIIYFVILMNIFIVTFGISGR